MKKRILVLAAISFMQLAQAQTSPKSAKPATTVKAVPAQPLKVGNAKLTMSVTPPLTIKNGKDSASYALGYRIAQSLNGQGLQKINLAVFNKGETKQILTCRCPKDFAWTTVLDNCRLSCSKHFWSNFSNW